MMTRGRSLKMERYGMGSASVEWKLMGSSRFLSGWS